jgi:hypothetical protein
MTASSRFPCPSGISVGGHITKGRGESEIPDRQKTDRGRRLTERKEKSIIAGITE